jgi:hypothetical protein
VISGRDSEFRVGKIILFESTQTGTEVLIEADEYLFVVDRRTLETCCAFEGGSVP